MCVLGRRSFCPALVLSVLIAQILSVSVRADDASTKNNTPAPLDLPAIVPSSKPDAKAHKAELEAEPPSAEETLRAFAIVEKWVRAWRVPEQLNEADGLPNASAACVSLRVFGKFVSRGEAVAAEHAGFIGSGGDADVIRLATQRALVAAFPKLNIPNDALRDQAIVEVARTITISLELAGPFQVMQPKTWGDVDAELAPGLDGVSVKVGATSGSHAVMFPSTMLGGGVIPSAGMKACASEVIGEGGAAAALDEPRKLRDQRGLTFAKFRSLHVQQNTPGSPARLLTRGREVSELDARAIGAQLRAMADAMVANLAAADPITLEASNVALAALALASASGTAGLDQKRADDAGLALLRSLGDQVRANDPTVQSPGVAALIQLARARAGTSWSKGLSPQASELQASDALQTRLPDNQLLINDTPAARTPLGVAGLVAVFRARKSAGDELEPNAALGALAEERLRSAIADAGDSRLISGMPWLGWAEHSMHADAATIPSAVAMRRMRSQIWQHQFTLNDAGRDNLDMVGGIVFTAGLSDGTGTPYPSWQCVRPLAFVATMLGDPRLTEPAERGPEIVRLMQAVRFFKQLQVDESNAWMYSDSARAMGAIRVSVWDKSIPTDATALTLLFVTELIKSLDAIAAESELGR